MAPAIRGEVSGLSFRAQVRDEYLTASSTGSGPETQRKASSTRKPLKAHHFLAAPIHELDRGKSCTLNPEAMRRQSLP